MRERGGERPRGTEHRHAHLPRLTRYCLIRLFTPSEKPCQFNFSKQGTVAADVREEEEEGEEEEEEEEEEGSDNSTRGLEDTGSVTSENAQLFITAFVNG